MLIYQSLNAFAFPITPFSQAKIIIFVASSEFDKAQQFSMLL